MRIIKQNEQPGFFDYQVQQDEVRRRNTALKRLSSVMEWGIFKNEVEKSFKQTDPDKGGRPRFDPMLMFKILVLQKVYGLSDEDTEFQLHDRISFRDFVGIQGALVPDANTIWDFREALTRNDVEKKLFNKFGRFLEQKGFRLDSGKIVDASFVEVPRQRNTREENEQIKTGEIPENWKKDEPKLRQKDVEARWTQKNDENYYGYKNHVKVDRKSKLIEAYSVTSANVHDSQEFEYLIKKDDGSVWGDSAYRSKEIEDHLRRRGIKSHIHEKGVRGKKLSAKQMASNHKKSKTRVRVEHVFGFMENSLGGLFSRKIGIARNVFATGLQNLCYNLFRYEFLVRG